MKGLSNLEDYIPKENLRQLQAAIETDQAVQRHVEKLAPYDSAIYILANGCTSQKLSMLQRLHVTLRDCDERKTSQLLSELTQAMWTQELELQVAAPEAIVTVLPRLSEQQIVSLLGGVKNMLAVKGEEARQAWSKLALELVLYMPVATLVSEMVPLILKKVAHSEPADQRILACRLTGRVCRRLPAETIVSTGLLQRAIGLCQDTERYMRTEMCGQLIEIAKAIGPAMTKEKITAELFQLVADEEPPVARAALSAVVLDFVDFYDASYRKEHVWPVLRSYIQSPQEEMVSLLSEVFGRFLCKIKQDLTSSPEDVALLANFFRMCSQKPDPELRRWCAFNFPAVVTVFPHSVFASTLTPVLKALACDPHVATRRCIAAGLHELIPLLGDKAAPPLKEPVLLLIQDSSLDVRHIVFGKLGCLLELFSQQLRNDEREAFFTAVMPHIVQYEKDVHHDWRRSATLLEPFAAFVKYFPGHALSQRLVPPVMAHLMNSAVAVKDMCSPILIAFTRALANNTAIAERFGKIVNDFGRSPNSHHRKTFVQLFAASVGVFSRRFIRVRLLETLLDLAKDPVPNVRIQLARAMPLVRKVLRAPVAPELLQSFQAAWARLLDDPDRDVREAAAQVRCALEDLERDLARQAAMRIVSADDAADRKRDEAEGDLCDISRDMEKTERRNRLRDMLLKEQAELGIDLDNPSSLIGSIVSSGNGGGAGGGSAAGKYGGVHGSDRVPGSSSGYGPGGRKPLGGPTTNVSTPAQHAAGGVGRARAQTVIGSAPSATGSSGTRTASSNARTHLPPMTTATATTTTTMMGPTTRPGMNAAPLGGAAAPNPSGIPKRPGPAPKK